MSTVPDLPPEAAPPAAEVESITSDPQAVQAVAIEQATAEPVVQAAPPAEATDEAPSVSAATIEQAAPTPGRGRGRGRGRGSNKRGTASKAASTSNAAATPGVGRGRGKRKSEAAALAHDAGVEADNTSVTAVEPRKRRKAAQVSKRIVESDDDDEDDTKEDYIPAPEVIPDAQDQSSAMQVDQSVERTVEAGPVEDVKAPQPAKRHLKVKLGFRRGSRQAESPVEPTQSTQIAEAAPPSMPAINTPTAMEISGKDNALGAEAKAVETSAETLVDQKKEEPVALPNLFDDDEPAQQPATKEASSEKETILSPAPSSSSAPAMSKKTESLAKTVKPSAVARLSATSIDKKPSPSGNNTPTGTPSLKKKLQAGTKPGLATGKTPAAASGSGTPTGSASSTMMKKRIQKPGVTGSSTPKVVTNAPAKAPQAETSFLDALFADTIPQTEHERQLQREREERNRKEQAAKTKKAKEDAEAKRKAASAAAATAAASAVNKPSPARLVPAGGKPPPVTLTTIKTVNPQRQPGTSVLSRLGGSEKLRQAEIEKLRAESRQQQEKLAEVGAVSARVLIHGDIQADFCAMIYRKEDLICFHRALKWQLSKHLSCENGDPIKE